MSLDEKEERARLARLASKVIATEEKTDEEKHQDAIKAKLLASRNKLLESEDKDRKR